MTIGAFTAVTIATVATRTFPTVTIATVAASAFPPVTITTDELYITAVIVPVVVVACLLVVCVIATIIILYKTHTKDRPANQQTTPAVLYDLPTVTHAMDGDNAPPIYSTVEEGAPDDYAVITDTANNNIIHVAGNPAYACSTSKDTPNKGNTIHVADNPAYCTIVANCNTPR